MILTLNDYGKYLFHFTSAQTALLYILSSKQLKLSPLPELNDPKENQTFGFWSIYSEIESDFRCQNIKKSFESFLKNKCRITCFSRDYQINNTNHMVLGYDHPNMWAHYADNYKGVCLVLDRSELFKETSHDNKRYFFDDIKYSELIDYDPITPKIFEEEWDQYFSRYLGENHNSFFFQKYLNWENEHETRIVHLGDDYKISIKDSLKGIIVGTYFNSSLNSLLRMMTQKDIWIEQLKILNGRLFPVLYEL